MIVLGWLPIGCGVTWRNHHTPRNWVALRKPAKFLVLGAGMLANALVVGICCVIACGWPDRGWLEAMALTNAVIALLQLLPDKHNDGALMLDVLLDRENTPSA